MFNKARGEIKSLISIHFYLTYSNFIVQGYPRLYNKVNAIDILASQHLGDVVRILCSFAS